MQLLDRAWRMRSKFREVWFVDAADLHAYAVILVECAEVRKNW
jgi:hypothetical protein